MIWSSAHCDLAVALARSCASATASCQEASPSSAAGFGAEGVLSPASEKMREDLGVETSQNPQSGPRRCPRAVASRQNRALERHGRLSRERHTPRGNGAKPSTVPRRRGVESCGVPMRELSTCYETV
jgi:hypothetical protein